MSGRNAPGVSGADGPFWARRRVVLVVGEADMASPAPFPSHAGVTFAEIHEVGAELIESLRPEIVLTPLLSPSFDCIDLALILHALDYRGAYRVLCPLLPSPELIRREIRALCPGLAFDLIFVGPPAAARA